MKYDTGPPQVGKILALRDDRDETAANCLLADSGTLKNVINDLSEPDLDAILRLISNAQNQIQEEIPNQVSNTYFDLLEVCMIVKFVFDTGCSTTLTLTDVKNYLLNPKQSRLAILLAHGDANVPAEAHGQLIAYAIGSDAAVSQPLALAVDTVPGLNESLLSFTQFYEKMGYNLHLGQPGESLSSKYTFSGMYRLKPDTGEWIDRIPFVYDPISHQWIVEMVVSKDGKKAKLLGDILTLRKYRDNKYSRKLSKARAIAAEHIETVHVLLTQMSKDDAVIVFDEKVTSPTGFDQYADDTDEATPFGITAGKFRTMSRQELHVALGHFGYLEGCIYCLQVKKNLTRIYKNPRPKYDIRPGHTYHADVIYWSFTGISVRGFKYTVILKCACTGDMEELNVATRDEVPDAFDNLITERRADSRFDQTGYKMFSAFHLDQAGEFTGASMKRVFAKHQIHEVYYADPVRKESAGPAEYAVQQLEIQVKKSMAQTMMPPSYFCWMVEHAVKLLRRVPLSRNIHSRHSDGIRPLEQITHGKISRRDCDNVIVNTEVPGTPCLITDHHTKGSDLDKISRADWAIYLGCRGISSIDPGNLPIFENLFTGTQRATKSFTAMPLAPGQNAWQLLGLTPPAPISVSAVPRQGENSHPGITIIKLPYDLSAILPNASITGLTLHDQPMDGEPVVKIFDVNGLRMLTNSAGSLEKGPMALPNILEQLEIIEKPSIDFGSFDYQTILLESNPKSFIDRHVYQYFGTDADPPGTYQGIVTAHEYKMGVGHQWQVKFPAIGNNNEFVCTYDQVEMQNYCIGGDSDGMVTAENIGQTQEAIEDKYLCLDDFQLYIAKSTISFVVACDSVGIPKSDRRLYYNWLQERFGYGPTHSNHPDAVQFDCPFSSDSSDKTNPRGHKFRPGTRFPKPAGQTWIDLKISADKISNQLNPVYVNAQLVRDMHNHVIESLRLAAKDTCPYIACDDPQAAAKSELLSSTLAELSLQEGAPSDELISALRVAQLIGDTDWVSAFNAKKVDSELADLIEKYVPNNKYVNESGKIIPPGSVSKALDRDDAPLWKYGMRKEQEQFDKLGVHSKPMTLAECRQEFPHIKTSPVRSHYIFDAKYSVVTDEFLKPKGRFVVDGTPSQMKHQEHFWESYANAPNTIATRFIQAIACGCVCKSKAPWLKNRQKKRFAADISTAFLHSILEKHEQFICMLPDGCEIFNSKGERCRYVAVFRGQYGTPASGYYWQRTRDTWILSYFNPAPGSHAAAQSKSKTSAAKASNFAPTPCSECEWNCRQCPLEPCMFIFTNVTNETVTHILIHVDDMDVVADSELDVEYIFEAMDAEWGITICDPNMLLGVERKMTETNGVRFLEFRMPNYIKDMYNEWHAKMTEIGRPMRNHNYTVPFPEGKQFSTAGTEEYPRPPDAEIDAVTALFMRFCGAFLWIARMSMPGLMFSASQFSRVLSACGWDHLKVGMQALQYAYDHRETGFRFRSDGNACFVASYDASDNPDPKDGKSQYGYSILLFDGPIATVSKKTARVGTSSTHNEFIAQAECIKTVLYVREMAKSWGFPEFCKTFSDDASTGPTILQGDNRTTTEQLRENRITERNRFYLSDYHFVREIYAEGHVLPTWIFGNGNGADMYTKALGRQLFDQFCPAETGYMDKTLPRPIISLTPTEALKFGAKI